MKLYLIRVIVLLTTLTSSSFAQWEYGGKPICDENWTMWGLDACNDGGSGVFLAWRDFRGSGLSDVYVQKIDSAGYVQWEYCGLPAVLSEAQQGSPHIIGDDSGGVYLAWGDIGRYYPNNNDVYAQHLDKEGQFIWPDTGLALSITDNHQFCRDIISDGMGGTLILWSDPTTIQHLDYQGNLLFGDDGLQMTQTPYSQIFGWLTPTSDSCYIAVWQDLRDTGLGAGAYAQKFSLNGDILWDPEGVPVVWDSISLYYVDFDVSYNPDGGIYILWKNGTEPRGIRFQSVNSDGVSMWGGAGIEIDTAFYATRPKVETTEDGYALIVWERDSGNFCLANLIDSSGVKMYTEDLRFDQIQHLYGITRSIGNEFEIFGRNINYFCPQRAIKYNFDTGFMWGDSGVCFTESNIHQHNLLPDQRGGAYIAWGQASEGDIFINRVYPNGWVAPDTTVGIEQEFPDKMEINTIDVYPNPFNSKSIIRLYLSEIILTKVDIYDLLGRYLSTIYNEIPSENNIRITLDMDGRNFKSGVYFIRVFQEKEVSSQKITLIK